MNFYVYCVYTDSASEEYLSAQMSKHMRCVYLTYFLQIIGRSLCLGTYYHDVYTKAAITSAVHQHYVATCIFIVHQDLNASAHGFSTAANFVVRMQKILHSHFVPVAALGADNNMRCGYGKNFGVIVAEERNLRESIFRNKGFCTKSIWLVFLREDEILEKAFEDTYIPLNCQLLVVHQYGQQHFITEIFHLKEKFHLRKVIYGIWSAEHGLQKTADGFYSRRCDLLGETVKVSTFKSYNGEFGLSQLRLLSQTLNFTYKYVKVKEMFPGRLTAAGYTGMLGAITRREVDMTIDLLTHTTARSHVVDFLFPTQKDTHSMFVKLSLDEGVTWTSYLSPFCGHLWGTVALVIVVNAVALAILTRSSGHEVRTADFLHLLLDVLAMFTLQGIAVSSRSSSARLVRVSAYATAIVVQAAYCANVVSVLASRRYAPPFSDLAGLLADGTYRVAVMRESITNDVFEFAGDNEMKLVYQNFIEPHSSDMPVLEEDIDRILCHHIRFCFIGESKLVDAHGVSCETFEVRLKTPPSHLGFALWKGHPYKSIFNHRLLMLNQYGILQKMREEIPHRKQQGQEIYFRTVELKHIAPVICLLCTNFVISLIILIFELLHYQFMQRRNNRHSPKKYFAATSHRYIQ